MHWGALRQGGVQGVVFDKEVKKGLTEQIAFL